MIIATMIGFLYLDLDALLFPVEYYNGFFYDIALYL